MGPASHDLVTRTAWRMRKSPRYGRPFEEAADETRTLGLLHGNAEGSFLSSAAWRTPARGSVYCELAPDSPSALRRVLVVRALLHVEDRLRKLRQGSGRRNLGLRLRSGLTLGIVRCHLLRG